MGWFQLHTSPLRLFLAGQVEPAPTEGPDALSIKSRRPRAQFATLIAPEVIHRDAAETDLGESHRLSSTSRSVT